MPRLPFREYGVRVVFLSTFLLAELLLLTGTWQLAYLAGFLAGILSPRIRRAVVVGGAGVLVAWSAYLVYVFVAGAGLQLADLVGAILGVGGGSWWLLTILTLLLGAVLGAVGGFTGCTAARLLLWERPGATPAAAKDAESPKS